MPVGVKVPLRHYASRVDADEAELVLVDESPVNLGGRVCGSLYGDSDGGDGESVHVKNKEVETF